MRKLTIATARSRHISRGWQNESHEWGALLERFSTATETRETLEEYKAMPREKKTDCKDVGGFVGGWVTNGRRRVENILCRDLLTYDYDDFDAASLERIRDAMAGKAWCLYSTHSHTDEDWRVRVIIPTGRSVNPDEFPAVARKVAEKLGMKGLDKGSFDLNRLMFWPSVAKGAPFMFEAGETADCFVNPDEIKAEYEDWRDAGQWPLADDEKAADLFNPQAAPGTALAAFSRRGNGGRLADPTGKKGIVGAWCRTYDVRSAIANFLSDHYEPAPNGHYTHRGSSTTGNAKIVDGGSLIYSFHGTDPLQRRMLNSWDLVRLAKFRHLDEDAGAETRTGRLPSTKAMEEFALADSRVKALYLREKGNDFEDIDLGEAETGEPETEAEKDAREKATDDLLDSLDLNKGEIAVTARNVERILNGDPRLSGKFRMDLFRDNVRILGKLPWNTHSKYWGNKDTDCLLTYFDKKYGMRRNTQIIERTFSAMMYDNGVHPVKEYLEGLPVWDGEKRLGRLFTDVLGAEATELNRKLAELIFTAAVRRIYEPGVKYDYCVVLYGPEGAYKSTLFSVMGGDWFSDSVNSIEGKEGMEGVQGIWIAEISELTGLKRSELATQKQFISRQEDIFRPAFGKMKEWRPRQCVMVGTTNEEHFLKGINDTNRRMPVVEIKPELRKIEENPREWLIGNRDQLWAEAVALEKKGEPLYLGDEFKEELRKIQEEHNMDLADPLYTAVVDFLDGYWLPYGWEHKSPAERAASVEDFHMESELKHRRTRVTIPEIVEECFRIPKGNPGYSAMSRRVGQYLKRIEGWQVAGLLRGVYGCQKTWERVESANEDESTFVCTFADPLNAL